MATYKIFCRIKTHNPVDPSFNFVFSAIFKNFSFVIKKVLWSAVKGFDINKGCEKNKSQRFFDKYLLHFPPACLKKNLKKI